MSECEDIAPPLHNLGGLFLDLFLSFTPGADETSEEQICRFLEEAQAMAQFNHPNILNLIGICLSDDVAPQILVPFMENGDLHSFLRRFDPTFSPGAVVSVALLGA